MASTAGITLLLGAVFVLDGKTSMALTFLCGTLFFLFAYFNPAMLESHGFMKSSIDPEAVFQKKFLWTSLAVGFLALILEFHDHLPLR
jgi:hypothetical protein